MSDQRPPAVAILSNGLITSGPASAEGQPGKRKRGRPVNDENAERRRRHQIQLLRKIQLRTGKSNAELEAEFKIGPESGGINGNQGKAWRRWVNGENVCRPAVLRTICKIATRRGWLDGDDLKENNGATGEGPLAELVSLNPDDWKHVASFQHRCEQAFQELTGALQNYERLLQQAKKDGHEVLEAWMTGNPDDNSADIEVDHLSEQRLQERFAEARKAVNELGCLSISWRFLREQQVLTERQRQLIKTAQDEAEKNIRLHVILDLDES
jgi:hypothetical protein